MGWNQVEPSRTHFLRSLSTCSSFSLIHGGGVGETFFDTGEHGGFGSSCISKKGALSPPAPAAAVL